MLALLAIWTDQTAIQKPGREEFPSYCTYCHRDAWDSPEIGKLEYHQKYEGGFGALKVSMVCKTCGKVYNLGSKGCWHDPRLRWVEARVEQFCARCGDPL